MNLLLQTVNRSRFPISQHDYCEFLITLWQSRMSFLQHPSNTGIGWNG